MQSTSAFCDRALAISKEYIGPAPKRTKEVIAIFIGFIFDEVSRG
jgi:hypothetical protein